MDLAECIKRANLGVVLTDPNQDDNPIIFANQGFLRLTGYDHSEILGRNCRFLQGELTAKEDVQRIREALRDGTDVSTSLLNYRADGSTFINRLLITPIEDSEGKVTGFLGILREVPEEEQIGTGGGQRPEHITASEVMLQEIQHRVKNHLAMVVSLIRLHANRPVTKESFLALSNRVEALALLYEELLIGEHAGRSETVAAGAYIKRVCKVLGDIAGRPSIQLKLDCAPIKLPVDPAGRLGLLVTEFLTNSFEHAFSGRSEGFIHVRLERNERLIRLCVEDNGIGLPDGSKWPYDARSVADQKTTARDAPGRLNTRSGENSTGLGGSIVLGLMKHLGAKLDIKSDRNGTKMCVTLEQEALPHN
nr:PAS domain-containing protein [Sphingomicrobium sp. B8]